MKVDSRNPKPVLNQQKLNFFYSILTLWESDAVKTVKKFNSAEIKRFLARTDYHNVKILQFYTKINAKPDGSKYRLYINDTKHNLGLSLLYHLRNAFAHNNIEVIDTRKEMIRIELIWKGSLKIRTTIPFSILKELIETIWGLHNLKPEEKTKKYPKSKKKDET